MTRIQPSEARHWNDQGYGIFWTVNSFNGERRKENLAHINSWAIDMDAGSKEEQFEKLRKTIVPSLLVETKRGFHAYWNAKDATLDHWDDIVLDRLIYHFNADKKARDVSRVLRVPGYYHKKDPKSPFYVRAIWKWDVSYTEMQMAHAFRLPPAKEVEVQHKQVLRRELKIYGDNLWERVWSLNCMDALERISGTECVNYERFTFKRVSSGNFNIFVNGKGTSCWIDQNKRIGSNDNGGPTIWNWIHWYRHDKQETTALLKRYFGELWATSH